jgi:hypothetical protein
MLLLRAIPGVNKEAPGLPADHRDSAGDACYHLWRNRVDRGDSFRALSLLPMGFAFAFAVAGVVGSILSLFVMRLIGVRPAHSIAWRMVAMQAQSLLSLLVAGVGTGFVLRHAGERVVSE